MRKRTFALIVAAGRGQRLGSDMPKQYLDLGGAPVLRHAARRLAEHPAIDGVQVVIGADDGADYAKAVAGLNLMPPTEGGASRQQSVARGLKSLVPLGPERVLVHDAARPGVEPAVVDRVLAALDHVPAAIPALALADTLKRADGMGRVTETLPRPGLFRVQTPQGFDFAKLVAAHEAFAEADMTDDAALMEAAGHEVRLVEGAEALDKITTREDLERARRLLGAGLETRIGQGVDVHTFGPGDGLTICGLHVPHSHGLVGHSDADVGLHALTDAILGALADGDIGQHFPPSDPQWRGADSALFLQHAAKLVAMRGGVIRHLDLTLICEAPKIGPHRLAMRERIAEILALDVTRISVKATTTERLGFTGRGEGIAAQAIATLALPA